MAAPAAACVTTAASLGANRKERRKDCYRLLQAVTGKSARLQTTPKVKRGMAAIKLEGGLEPAVLNFLFPVSTPDDVRGSGRATPGGTGMPLPMCVRSSPAKRHRVAEAGGGTLELLDPAPVEAVESVLVLDAFEAPTLPVDTSTGSRRVSAAALVRTCVCGCASSGYRSGRRGLHLARWASLLLVFVLLCHFL